VRRLVLMVSLAIARTAAAGPELSDHQTLMLGDRISIRLPEGMKSVPNQRDFYGLGLPEAVAHRAELTLTNGAVYVVVRQTFTDVEGDFRRAVNAELALQDVVGITRTVKLPGDVDGVTVDPPAPRRGDEHDLIHAVYVRGLSPRVYSISFYASGGAYDDIATWIRLAQQSTSTATFSFGGPPAVYSNPISTTLGRTAVRLAPFVDWAVVPIRADGANAVIAYQHGALGTPTAVCGIDQHRAEASAGAAATRIQLVGTTETARSWKAGTRGHAEVASSRGGRVWCRVRGGKPDDALAALRTITAATNREPETSSAPPR
jgi:hypothetical protein